MFNNYKEIVTKAIIGKGKKTFKNDYEVTIERNADTVLGCWVINHNIKGEKDGDYIKINGSYDINIWYSYDNDTKTDVVKESHSYSEMVKMHEINDDYDNTSIIVRSLTDPKCVSVNIDGNIINYQVNLELGIELVGDVKVKIEVNDNLDDYSLIEEEKKDDDALKKIDEEVKEDYLEG
jgi:spore coat protein E